MYQNIKHTTFHNDTITLTMNFLRTVVPRLAPLVDGKLRYEDWNKVTPERLDSLFTAINEKLRFENVAKLKELGKTAHTSTLPQALLKPLPAKLTASFGEERTYLHESNSLGKSIHEGYDLASVKRDTVFSAGAGKVLYAGPLGIYGNAIAIDHGFGVMSLYGHLSSTAVKAGKWVTAGERIGASGSTGLAGGDHLHFEVRVQGEAVDPNEWMDSHWVQTRILNVLLSNNSVLKPSVLEKAGGDPAIQSVATEASTEKPDATKHQS
jgi:murein DD-endopeptidase MepM/ murein hydrolase activator NlpD